MARIAIDGLEIEYELLGPASGPAAAITPGGRFSKTAVGIEPLGRALAEGGVRVLLWDRPNCGASDLCFEGASESAMQAGVLTKLIGALDLGPTALIGGSAGARISLLAAKADPAIVSRMMLWWISGGVIGLLRLGSYYCCEPAEVADQRGMEAVAAMPIWAQQMAANPRNRGILLAEEPRAFIAKMERWAAGYIPSTETPIAGIAPADFARMTMPVVVLRGSPRDIYHPAWVSERVAALLPNATMADPPWDLDVFATRMVDGRGLFSDWPGLAPQIFAWLRL